MNLAEIREVVQESMAQLVDDLEAATINSAINRAYGFTIPSDLGGELAEIVWSLTLEAGTATYEYLARIHSPRNRPWISADASATPMQSWLSVETDPAMFEARYVDSNGATQGQPVAALFYGRQVEFSPIPDQAYIVQIPCRGGPVTLSDDAATIENELLAMAVAREAARDLAKTYGDEATAALMAEEYGRLLMRLAPYSYSRTNRRRPARSF